MTPTYDNGVVRLYQGDARELSGIPDESVHCIVTSPPYWGLRDYGLGPSVWDGDPEHEHEWGDLGPAHQSWTSPRWKGCNKENAIGQNADSGQFCSCGAWRGTLGLEPTIDLYVEHMVEIFRELWRVLRKDGTCWLNIGDSYSGYHGNSRVPDDKAPSNKPGYVENMRASTVGNGLKPKDLCMMPARVALALQADGWWLRSDIPERVILYLSLIHISEPTRPY